MPPHQGQSKGMFMTDDIEAIVGRAFFDIEQGMREIFTSSHFVAAEINDVVADENIKTKVKEYYEWLFNAVHWKLRDLVDEYHDSPNIRRKILTGQPEAKPYALVVARDIWDGFRAGEIKESQHHLIEEAQKAQGDNTMLMVLLHAHGVDILVSLKKIEQACKNIELALGAVEDVQDENK